MRRRTFMFKRSAVRFANEMRCRQRLIGGPEKWAGVWVVYYNG